jgi:bacillithiol biosynthesis deacetylase BshB1
MSVDILVFGPHPDDAEIGAGGLLLKMKALGYRTGIVHLTSGEMGSRGNADTRRAEVEAAAKILKLDHVQILDFQDCQVTDTYENRLKIARVVRIQRPSIVLAPYWQGVPGRGLGHTDHITTGMLVSHAVNFARLHKMPLSEEPHAVDRVFYYFLPSDTPPTFVVDISEYAEAYLEAIKCHHSQFFNPETEEFEFLSLIAAAAQNYGRMIRAKWGQGYLSASPLPVTDPFLFTAKAQHKAE